MANLTVVITDNSDGTVTMSMPTSLSASSAVDTKVTTDSLGTVMSVIKGWLFQANPLLKIN